MVTPFNVVLRLSQQYMFASYKVLLNIVNMNAATPHHDSNYTLIVEISLSHLINLYIDYSKNRVVQKRTPILRNAVARMIHPVYFLYFGPK